MTRLEPRKELVTAVLLLVFGVAILPALIYLVGTLVVGPYEDGSGISGLYGKLFQALIEPQAAAWLLILSPYVVVVLLRAVIALGPRKSM